MGTLLTAAGGNAGSPGLAGTGGTGGGAGTLTQGGAAGVSIGSSCGGVPATPGAFGLGGKGDDQTASGGGGSGGGGGGYYGGGGGGGCATTMTGGAGGGGGSSFPSPGELNATTPVPTKQSPEVMITPLTTASFSPAAGLAFPGTQPEQTLSASQTLTLTNTGDASLEISGLTFSGTDPQDFLISSDGCLGDVPGGASCTLGVSFAPQGVGSRTATLNVASDGLVTALSVPLSGTATAPPATGTSTPAGVEQGPAGPAGPTGPAGPAGKVELVTCHTVTKTVSKRVRGKTRKVHHTTETCTTRLVSGTVKVTPSSERASISRGSIVYASGTAARTASGRWQLILSDVHPLRRGHYTLTLHLRHGQTRHVTITLA